MKRHTRVWIMALTQLNDQNKCCFFVVVFFRSATIPEYFWQISHKLMLNLSDYPKKLITSLHITWQCLSEGPNWGCLNPIPRIGSGFPSRYLISTEVLDWTLLPIMVTVTLSVCDYGICTSSKMCSQLKKKKRIWITAYKILCFMKL